MIINISLFFYKVAFMFLSTSVNYLPELLNLFATAFLRCFRKVKCLSLTCSLLRTYDILGLLSRTLDSLHPKTINKKLRRSLVHGTTQTLCILKKRKNTEIETKLEYSYSSTVALNNIFFQKSTRFFPEWNGL